jgi:two-component system alkaline phosphatase synthesis response regulator PhoP
MAGKRDGFILIVEDEETVGKLLQWQLEWGGYSTVWVASGKAALVAAAERRPDLVLLDILLPDVDGYEVCRQLRQRYHQSVMPVVMLTALSQPVDQLRGFAHGADAYLTKPYDGDELLRTIELLLEKSTLP